MVTVNKNYLKLPGSYLFSTIAKKVAAYQEATRMFRSSVLVLVMSHSLWLRRS